MTVSVNPNERLTAIQVCVWLNMGTTAFDDQVRAGIWDGTYVVTGQKREFIARLVEERQLELARRVAEGGASKAA